MRGTSADLGLELRGLDIPEGPWKADVWLMRRPVRHETSGTQPCLVDGCGRPAGTASGETPKETDRLCVAHRRRRDKAGQPHLTVEEFALEQAQAAPIREPRGAQTAKPNFPPVDFTGVLPTFAEELRWVTAVKILRGQWRNDAYVNQTLRHFLKLGAEHNLRSLNEIPALRAADGSPVEHGKFTTNVLPAVIATLRHAATDSWQSLYWHPADHSRRTGDAGRAAINWESVTCDWLRSGLMAYSADLIKSGARAWGTVENYRRAGSLLSAYMEDHEFVGPSEVTRRYFLNFLAWVRDEDVSRTDLGAVNTLARLLFDLRDRGYVPDLPETVYLLRGENPTTKQRKPKPFPEDLLQQIDGVIASPDALPDDVRLLMRIFRAVCPRPSEALALPIDAIAHGQRGYSLEYFQSKTQTWRRVPLPEALGRDLAAQASRVRERTPHSQWLFPYEGPSPRINTLATASPVAAPWPYNRFTDTVWTAYEAAGVRSSSLTGEVLTGSQLHRFRHSIATGLLKEGWSQYEVQKFLGHSSPTMMQAYAEIHEDTLRSKYEEFVKHSVDVTGTHQAVDAKSQGDVERLRDRMTRSALPNGYCTLPETASCDFVPSPCLTCTPFFRTTPTFLPIHIRQRDESMRELELAKEQGRERAVEAHEKTLSALNLIIEGLEAEEAS